MMRILTIKGSGERPVVEISVDGKGKEFELNQDISAEDIYSVLDYKRGDEYKVERGEQGAIDKTAFEAFCSLLENIAKEINKYAEEIEDSECV